jgi:hypothetical protein
MSGSGKTNLVAVIAEAAHTIGLPFLIIDPSGDYASLKSLGRVLVVGSQGDIKNTFPQTEWIQQTIAAFQSGRSIVIEMNRSTNQNRLSIADKREMFTLIISHFLTLQQNTRYTALLIIEEAHLFAPQKQKGKQDIEALTILEEIARMGRRSGILLALASQRPRDLEADIATQCNLTFIGHLEHRLDYVQVQDLLYVPTTQTNGRPKPPPPRNLPESMMTVSKTPTLIDLSELKAGQFYVRIGAKLRLAQIKRRQTQHLGATPPIQLSMFKET